MKAFKMGSLDHIHLMVPDRYEAAAWYAEHLGFEVVEPYEVWAKVEGGPLHLSADGGRSGLALFERGAGHPDFKIEIGVAFAVDAESFVAFASNLEERELSDGRGGRIRADSVVDHDLCYAFYFEDPYGNAFELDCYDHAAVKRMLVDAQGISPIRFW